MTNTVSPEVLFNPDYAWIDGFDDAVYDRTFPPKDADSKYTVGEIMDATMAAASVDIEKINKYLDGYYIASLITVEQMRERGEK